MVMCSFLYYFLVLVTLALFVASKEVLDVSAEKTGHIFMSREQNAYPKIANKSFGKVSKFKCVGTTLKINSMRDEIKSGINSGNVCCLSVQIFSVSRVRKER
jgi:hypothetical protein